MYFVFNLKAEKNEIKGQTRQYTIYDKNQYPLNYTLLFHSSQ